MFLFNQYKFPTSTTADKLFWF